jgi:Zn-dependent M28 family amino/carboxypeptidase
MSNDFPTIADSDPRVLAERLRTHVDRLAGLIGPRHLGKPVALEAAATYIEREFQASGDTVERQWYEAQNQRTCNLVVERTGTKRRDEIVILGAHYDTVWTTPGADDNASAVAVLIEAARLLRGTNFRRTVRFVAFTCEEPPHFNLGTMGSQVYARSCRERNERIVGMLCLEMVGYFTTADNSQALPPAIPRRLRWLFPRRGDFLTAAGNLRSWRLAWSFRRGFKRAVRFPLFSIVFPEAVREIRLSDNSSFWDQGYPALMLTDTSFLRNPHYHQPTDTPETLAYEPMAQVTLGVAGAVRRLGQSDTRRPLTPAD